MPLYLEPKSRDLEGLDRWIHDSWKFDVIPYLPDAIFELEDTLVLHNKSGKTIQTSGRRRFFSPFDPRIELNGGPLIVFKGKAPHPVIRIDSCMSLIFQPFTLTCGVESRTDGIVCENATGYGNSNHIFEGTQILGCDAAWRMGSSEHPDCNNSDISFHNIAVSDCTHGLMTLQDQALNFYFYAPQFFHMESAITANKGGAVHLFGGATYNVDWLFSQGVGGPNIMANSASGVRTDGGGLKKRQSGWLRTIEKTPAYMSTYHFNALSDVGIEADVNKLDQYLIDVVGGVNVLLTACTIQSRLARVSGGGDLTATVTAENCRLMGDIGEVVRKPASISVRNCFDRVGKLIEDKKIDDKIG